MSAPLRRPLAVAASRVVAAALARHGDVRAASEVRPQCGSVLVVELSRLGDAIQAHSVAAHLRRTGFAASVSLAVDASWAPLFESAGAVDRVVPVAAGGRKPGALLGLGGARHDLVLNPSPSVRNTLATFLAGAPARAGYLDFTSPLTPFRDSFVVARTRGGGRGATARVLAGTALAERADPVLALVGAPRPVELAALRPPQAAAERVMEWGIARWGAEAEGPLVVLHPGATWRLRAWPGERWVELARALVGAHRARVVVLGARAEHALVGRVVAGVGHPDRVEPWVDRRLDEVAALLASADVHVGADSGPLHLASALGTPAVGLFGPASPRLTAPLGFRGAALHVAFPCAPCDQRRCVSPTEPCIHALSVPAVATAVERVWRGVSGG